MALARIGTVQVMRSDLPIHPREVETVPGFGYRSWAPAAIVELPLELLVFTAIRALRAALSERRMEDLE